MSPDPFDTFNHAGTAQDQITALLDMVTDLLASVSGEQGISPYLRNRIINAEHLLDVTRDLHIRSVADFRKAEGQLYRVGVPKDLAA